MFLLKNSTTSFISTSKNLLAKSILLLFCILPLSGCDLLKSEIKEYLFQFNSADGSLGQVIADGYLLIDGVRTDLSTGNIQELSVSEEFIFLTMTVGGDTYYLRIPSQNKSFDLIEDYLDDAMTMVSNSYTPVSGIGGLNNFTVKATDTYEGTGSFNLTAVGEFRASNSSQPKQLVFEFELDFDTERTGGISGGGGSSGGGSTGGGTGSTSCVNSIDAKNLVSYWPQIKSGAATGTGKRVAGNTIFADYKASDVALVLDGSAGGTRYVIQIMLTGPNLVANKTLEFRNAGTGTGLTSTGAVGRLIAFNGTVNDDWRTNRDFGKNKNMGTLKILTVSPKITGTYSFQASGDGYPSLNNQFVNVSGSFCIDP